jgi:hypothetical protein
MSSFDQCINKVDLKFLLFFNLMLGLFADEATDAHDILLVSLVQADRHQVKVAVKIVLFHVMNAQIWKTWGSFVVEKLLCPLEDVLLDVFTRRHLEVEKDLL